MHDVLAHRVSLLSLHAGALEFRPDAPPEEIAEAAGVIRATAHAVLEELREVIGVLREGDEAHRAPAADARDIPGARRGVARRRHEGRVRASTRTPSVGRGDRPHRVPDRPGGPHERAQARARRGRRVSASRRAPSGGLTVEVVSRRAVGVPAGGPPPPRRGQRAGRPRRAGRAGRRRARARAARRRRPRPARDAAVIRVLLVDDDPLVRSGLRMMLAGAEGIEVVGEADDGRGVLAAVDLHRPDVVLMDIRMPQLDGIAATRLLREQPGAPAVIVLTTFDADELVLRALQAGAAGFLLKDTPPAEIVRAIELVHAGDGMLSPGVTRRLIALVAGDGDAGERRERARALLATLSEREREVALAVGAGRSNAEIAAELHMSVATVKAHVSRLLTKLEADNRVQVALLVQDAAAVAAARTPARREPG